MHLLTIELNLETGTLEHTIENAVDERRTKATMQSEVQTQGTTEEQESTPFATGSKGETQRRFGKVRQKANQQLCRVFRQGQVEN